MHVLISVPKLFAKGNATRLLKESKHIQNGKDIHQLMWILL